MRESARSVRDNLYGFPDRRRCEGCVSCSMGCCSSRLRRSRRTARSTPGCWPSTCAGGSRPDPAGSSPPAAPASSTRSRRRSTRRWSRPRSRRPDRRVPVFAGCGGPLPTAVRLARMARDAGADGLLLMPPYLVAGPPAGLIAYTKAVAAATELPLIVYQRGSVVFDPASAVSVAALPTVVGLQGRPRRPGPARPDRRRGRPGAAGQAVPVLQRDADGGGDRPGLPGDRRRAVLVGRVLLRARGVDGVLPGADRGRHGHRAAAAGGVLLPPLAAPRDQVPGYAVSLVKAGVRLRGLDAGGVRPPLVDPSPEHLEELGGILAVGLAAVRRMSRDALRITGVTITPVAFADPPLLNAVGVHEPFALRAVVEVATDGGLTGLGETLRRRPPPGGAARAAADAVVGVDAYHTEEVYRRVAERRRAGRARDRVGTVGERPGRRPGVLPVRGGLPGHPGQGGRPPGVRPAGRRGQGRGAVLGLPVLQVGRAPGPGRRTAGARRSTRTASSGRPAAWSTPTGSRR